MRIDRIFLRSFSGISVHVWILAASMFINRTGSMVIAFMSLYLTKELHYSMGQAGLVMAAYGTGSIIGSYAGGWITDRRNVHGVMVYSLLVSGLFLVPLLFFTNFYAILGLVFFYSLVADTFRPANSVAVAKFSTDETRTRAFSLMRLAINLGFGIGPALGGIVAVSVGFKWIFLIDAITSVAAAAMVLMYLPKKQLDRVSSKKPEPISRESSAFFDRGYLLFLLLVSGFGTCFFQLFASVPVYFSKSFHYSEDVIGYLLALNGFLVVLMEMPLVYKMEQFKSKYLFIAVGCGMMALAYFILFLRNDSLTFSIAYTFFITLAEIMAMPFMMSFVFSQPSPTRQGQYMALYSVAYGISHIIAPVAGLYLAEQLGFDKLYLLTALLSLILAFLFYGMLLRKSPATLVSTA
ncbi:MAG: MFS transporter [Saprospiraceae bacterium]|nr:MFS transporter [Saprospiraceae bacterium]